VCIYMAPLVLRSSYELEPNSKTLVVYDAVNHV
jgi:hypothetical protein